MALSILNNIPALEAENQLSVTTAAANKSLQELASGSRINSGSDDAAGSGHLRRTQRQCSCAESIGPECDERDRFPTDRRRCPGTDHCPAQSLGDACDGGFKHRTEYVAVDCNQHRVSSARDRDRQHWTSTNFNGTAVFGSTVSAYTTDGTAAGTVNISANVASLATLASGLAATSLTGATPTAGATAAQAALAVITTAISTVSSQRGTLGATVEQLQAASTVDTDESQNLQSASSDITSADISTVVANDTKYSILEQTGISALQQANQQAQTVLKLLQ